VIVAPGTTTIRGLPSEVELDPARDPVMRTCVVSLDSWESLNLEVFIELEPGRMRQLCAALAIAVDC
jgi:mRNA interferase MazF